MAWQVKIKSEYDKDPEIDISMIGIRYGEKMDLYPYWGQYFYFVIKYVCTNPYVKSS